MQTTTSPTGTTVQPQRARRRKGLGFWIGRVLLTVLALLVALPLVGASYEVIMAAGDATRYPPAGQLVDIGGHRLHLHCVGEGSPTVIMEGGGGGNILHWMLVQPSIAQSTRVCAYDRAGMGWSD